MSVNTFGLEIVSSNRIFYAGKAKVIILPAADGEVAIMAHHSSMTVALEIGEIRIKLEDDTWITGIISSGFAEIANNRVYVYVYSCERPEEIDIVRAQEAKERAEEQLRQKQSLTEYHQSKASLARAMARLKMANRNTPIGM